MSAPASPPMKTLYREVARVLLRRPDSDCKESLQVVFGELDSELRQDCGFSNIEDLEKSLKNCPRLFHLTTIGDDDDDNTKNINDSDNEKGKAPAGGSTSSLSYVALTTALTFCSRHSARAGSCPNDACAELHFCLYFLLSGRCLYGAEQCLFGHELGTGHNRRLLRRHRLGGLRVPELRTLLCLPRVRRGIACPKLCIFYNKVKGCSREEECHFLHLCKFYIQGECKFSKGCKRNHDVDHPQVQQVLELYGVKTQRRLKDVVAELKLFDTQQSLKKEENGSATDQSNGDEGCTGAPTFPKQSASDEQSEEGEEGEIIDDDDDEDSQDSFSSHDGTTLALGQMSRPLPWDNREMPGPSWCMSRPPPAESKEMSGPSWNMDGISGRDWSWTPNCTEDEGRGRGKAPSSMKMMRSGPSENSRKRRYEVSQLVESARRGTRGTTQMSEDVGRERYDFPRTPEHGGRRWGSPLTSQDDGQSHSPQPRMTNRRSPDSSPPLRMSNRRSPDSSPPPHMSNRRSPDLSPPPRMSNRRSPDPSMTNRRSPDPSPPPWMLNRRSPDPSPPLRMSNRRSPDPSPPLWMRNRRSPDPSPPPRMSNRRSPDLSPRMSNRRSPDPSPPLRMSDRRSPVLPPPLQMTNRRSPMSDRRSPVLPPPLQMTNRRSPVLPPPLQMTNRRSPDPSPPLRMRNRRSPDPSPPLWMSNRRRSDLSLRMRNRRSPDPSPPLRMSNRRSPDPSPPPRMSNRRRPDLSLRMRNRRNPDSSSPPLQLLDTEYDLGRSGDPPPHRRHVPGGPRRPAERNDRRDEAQQRIPPTHRTRGPSDLSHRLRDIRASRQPEHQDTSRTSSVHQRLGESEHSGRASGARPYTASLESTTNRELGEPPASKRSRLARLPSETTSTYEDARRGPQRVFLWDGRRATKKTKFVVHL